MLFLVEDLHWADLPSVRYLEAGLRSLSEQPLTVFAFARPEVRETYPNLWAEREPARGPLAQARSTRVRAAARVARRRRAPRRPRAPGSPSVQTAIPSFSRSWCAGCARTRKAARFPDTILGIIQARLDSLGEELKHVIRAASVFGQSFRVEGLQALLGSDTLSADLSAWLRLLTEREVFYPRGEASEREYVFRHALIHDAAYALLPDSERTLGHRLAAEWLERCGSNDAALLASHFEQGDDAARAATWYAAAAHQALEAGSLQEVIRSGERALGCGLSGVPFCELASIVAEALSYQRDDLRAAEWAESALEQLEPGSQAWWRALQVLAISHLRLRTARVIEIVGSIFERTVDEPRSPEQVIAIGWVASNAFCFGQRELGVRLLELLAHEVPASFGDRASAVVHAARSVRGFADDNLSCALASARDALSAFRRVCAVRDVSQSLIAIGQALQELGVYDEAERSFEEAAHTTLSETDRLLAQIYLGICHLHSGRFDQAARILTQVVEGGARIGVRALEGYALSFLAVAQAQSGALEAAAKALTRALEIGETDPEVRALALTGQARLRLLEGRLHDALLAAEQAMALLRDHQIVEGLRLHARDLSRGADRLRAG